VVLHRPARAGVGRTGVLVATKSQAVRREGVVAANRSIAGGGTTGGAGWVPDGPDVTPPRDAIIVDICCCCNNFGLYIS
jgi:hypothetical protein